MADLYNAPELLNSYCANECPIGCRKETATEVKSLQQTTIGLIDLTSGGKLDDYMKELVHIAVDGKVSESEREKMNEIVAYLNHMRVLVEELTLFNNKSNKEAK